MTPLTKAPLTARVAELERLVQALTVQIANLERDIRTLQFLEFHKP